MLEQQGWASLLVVRIVMQTPQLVAAHSQTTKLSHLLVYSFGFFPVQDIYVRHWIKTKLTIRINPLIPGSETWHIFLCLTPDNLFSSMDLFSLYVLFSHFRPSDVPKGIFFLFLHTLCIPYARAEDNIWKKLFPGVTSHGLKWENKTYKLKRSIGEVLGHLRCQWINNVEKC